MSCARVFRAGRQIRVPQQRAKEFGLNTHDAVALVVNTPMSAVTLHDRSNFCALGIGLSLQPVARNGTIRCHTPLKVRVGSSVATTTGLVMTLAKVVRVCVKAAWDASPWMKKP